MSLSKDNSSRRVVLVLTTSFLFLLRFVFFFNGKDKIPVCFSSERPIHFSFQFLSFCVIITFATVKQARKNKGNSLDSA